MEQREADREHVAWKLQPSPSIVLFACEYSLQSMNRGFNPEAFDSFRVTMIRVLAYTLTLVFFHRQVHSHLRKCLLGFCDLAQELAYWFLIPQADSS